MYTDTFLNSCRFIFGGDQGKLRYAPPDEHVPVYESLVAKEKLSINPSFHFGEIPKGIVSGPLIVHEYTAFVPKPVETGHVSTNMDLFSYFFITADL